ncbi:hypothetical protein BJP43_10230 (plasmid) [Candidatus Williamhamiltonella defendens]|uniref:Tn3 transposase DDE domain-containing protein n=1 Tax=Candidatus Williamhamiltonella defendens TaxID=138072 RepID=A0A2D3TG13_9ENTR|nr:hypothetical protein BJP43_10175 [Candidatus Hamiltonella defensa]ATW34766.1 hypothetical protein BJP43_10230 [Candidatus Hamiltonella defensa]AYB49968.1 hypothetical protein CJJ19_11135 [Candidatus Hamiltonella defensa]
MFWETSYLTYSRRATNDGLNIAHLFSTENAVTVHFGHLEMSGDRLTAFILCWNYLYLARQLDEKATDTEARENLIRAIAAHVPMTWAHINMLGEYDFSDEKLRYTLGILPRITDE